jgi:pimeloyl-ACP methyl ester carboxylesterase
MTSNTTPRRRPPIRWWWVCRTFFLTMLAIPLALAALGAAYEAVMSASDAQRYPPTGRLIDIGGYRLHLVCVGTTGPTVVLESGYNSTSLDWMQLQQQIAEERRVCAYDRAGSGWSDPGPLPRTPERIVADLHALLMAAGERGPYILVGHSMGGRYVRLFALRYPREVAGLVLVDARSEEYDQIFSAAERAGMVESDAAQGQQLVWLRRLGLVRLAGPQVIAHFLPGDNPLPPDLRQIALLHMASPATQRAISSEMAEREQSDTELQQTPLGNLPLRVLVATESAAVPGWMASQEAQAASSSASALRRVPGGHNLPQSNTAAVSAAVREIAQMAWQ